MNIVIQSCLRGEYPVANQKELEGADVIIAQSFGTRERSEHPSGVVNAHLAKRAEELAELYVLPVVAQEEIAETMPDELIDVIASGDSSSSNGSGLDSWGVLLRAQHELGEGLRPILVAQAYHVGRVAMQAVKLGMDPRLPGGLPREFAPQSHQWWTRSHGLWVARELPGMAALKAQGKL